MIHVGTSGYNYPEWKGRFYPEKLAAKAMLPYYAGVFDTVEINYTFYRMPTPALVEGWAGQVPEGFTFTQKARSGSLTSCRRRSCVIRLGAFSVKVKPSGTWAAQPSTSAAVGMR